MGRETNIHTIISRALEKQIEEGKRGIIKLKRTRNSPLNVSARVPPEILGYIFVWSPVREAGHSLFSRYFDGLWKGSFNFLLVCHYWSEVVSRTPELWNWGSSLQDWKKRHRPSGVVPLDLVPDGAESDPHTSFDESLQDAIRCRVIRGSLRQVLLASDDNAILTSVISSLTPTAEVAKTRLSNRSFGETGVFP